MEINEDVVKKMKSLILFINDCVLGVEYMMLDYNKSMNDYQNYKAQGRMKGDEEQYIVEVSEDLQKIKYPLNILKFCSETFKEIIKKKLNKQKKQASIRLYIRELESTMGDIKYCFNDMYSGSKDLLLKIDNYINKQSYEDLKECEKILRGLGEKITMWSRLASKEVVEVIEIDSNDPTFRNIAGERAKSIRKKGTEYLVYIANKKIYSRSNSKNNQPEEEKIESQIGSSNESNNGQPENNQIFVYNYDNGYAEHESTESRKNINNNSVSGGKSKNKSNDCKCCGVCNIF